MGPWHVMLWHVYARSVQAALLLTLCSVTDSFQPTARESSEGGEGEKEEMMSLPPRRALNAVQHVERFSNCATAVSGPGFQNPVLRFWYDLGRNLVIELVVTLDSLVTSVP